MQVFTLMCADLNKCHTVTVMQVFPLICADINVYNTVTVMQVFTLICADISLIVNTCCTVILPKALTCPNIDMCRDTIKGECNMPET